MNETRQKKILFIEDDKKFGQPFHDRLRKEGYYVLWQQSPLSAGMWATFSRSPWDMIISDQRMPEESGSELLVLLHELETTDLSRPDPKSEVYRKLRKHYESQGELEFLSALKEIKSRPTLRVVLSGYAEDQGIKEAVQKGIIHKFISKKEDTDNILATIRNLLSRG